ncbi:MAG TPA: MFS transporter [Nocardioides sp.]|uniref:MFS transporter n=1 Tax=Nocardioides sp. TaxID=35761 RepID=UPI002E36EE2A|nr:MFS transporter [Nocardioides sp.]HEX3931431.1 MFS transporter [Nocardioides sp.]
MAPARLGPSFRWLLASSWVAAAGDGLALSAGPLLVASQSHNAILVASATLLQRLPWLVLGLHAGAIADRFDRRVMVALCDGMRAVVLFVLSTTILTGEVSIVVVLVAMLLLGIAEVFSETAARTLLPMVVDKDDLGIGNARLQTGFVGFGQLLGPALGAVLFTAGHAVPFVTQTVCVALGVLLIWQIATPKGGVATTPRRPIGTEIREGIAWLMGHPAIRTLALVIVTFNITFATAWSTLVLYATQHLHMSESAYGLLATSAAVGGLVSTSFYGWLERRIRLGTLMRACLIMEVLLHLSFALNSSPVIAVGLMFVFGLYAFVWNTLSQSVRQRAVPTEFQGRVGSVYSVGSYGGLVVGLALGGPIAHIWGLTAPFWVGFVGSALTLAVMWRSLTSVAHLGETPVPADEAA